MHAPAHACLALYRLHPQLRLAWVGRGRRFEDEQNPGSYAVVQLYHVHDCGDLDEPLTFREFWGVTTRMTDDGVFERVKIDRGPIFNRFGGTSLDYDPLIRVPVWAMTLDEQYCYPDGEPIKREDVFSHKFLIAVRHGLTDIRNRVKTARAETGRDLERRVDAISNDMTDFLWRQANQSNADRDTSITCDEASRAMRQAERRWAARSELPAFLRA